MFAVWFRKYPVAVGQNDGLVVMDCVNMRLMKVSLSFDDAAAITYPSCVLSFVKLDGFDYDWFLSVFGHDV